MHVLPVSSLLPTNARGGNLVDVIINETIIDKGEPYFIIYVDRPKVVGQSIVADLQMDLTGPVTPDRLTPRRLSGFELPAARIDPQGKGTSR